MAKIIKVNESQLKSLLERFKAKLDLKEADDDSTIVLKKVDPKSVVKMGNDEYVKDDAAEEKITETKEEPFFQKIHPKRKVKMTESQYKAIKKMLKEEEEAATTDTGSDTGASPSTTAKWEDKTTRGPANPTDASRNDDKTARGSANPISGTGS